MADLQSSSGVAPVSRAARIASLDVLRGVAVLGILLMNITGFALLPAAYGNPTVAGGATGANLAAWITTTLFFEGTMRGIFSMLFGASIVLLTGRMADAGAGLETAEIYFRRMIWMLVFGFVHWALLLWYGEILFAYAICGLLLFAVRGISPRVQLAAAFLLLAVSVASNALDYRKALAEQAAAQQVSAAVKAGKPADDKLQALAQKWEARVGEYKPTAKDNRAMIELHRGSYPNAVAKQWPFSFYFQWVGAPYWLLLDMIPFMLLGMALLRFDVLSGNRPLGFYLALAAGGYGVGLPLNWIELQQELGSGFAVIAHVRSGVTYEISRLAMLFGHLGLILAVIRLGWLQGLQARLAAVGQMALSNYVAQTLICTFLFFGFGLDQYMRLERLQLYGVVALIWAAELVWSPLWLSRFRFGPLEWLWRSLTYVRRQPMRRATPLPA